MSSPGKLHSLLATARIANVPSVVSNVWTGVAIAAAFQRWEHHDPVWSDGVLLALAGVLLYVAGNFFNDWHDRLWDAKNRPERALPSGLFKPGTYLVAALALAVSGILFAFAAAPASGLVAVLIAFFIIIYTVWHKKAVWPVIPMGLCRALLVVMGFVAIHRDAPAFAIHDTHHLLGLPIENSLMIFHATALLIYISGLSLGARYESSPNPSKPALLISKLALAFSGLLAAILWFVLKPAAVVVALLPFAIWLSLCLTRYRRPIPVHVSALLAGIPLLDAIAMLSYTSLEPPFSYPPALQPYLLACIAIPLLAFVTGRILQRVAPAT